MASSCTYSVWPSRSYLELTVPWCVHQMLTEPRQRLAQASPSHLLFHFPPTFPLLLGKPLGDNAATPER